MYRTIAAFVACALLAAPCARGTSIYADSLAPGFSDYSYSSVVDFANAAPVHSGTASIKFTPTGYGALKLASSSLLDAMATPALKFWFQGTPAQCQALSIQLEREVSGTDAQVGNDGPLADYIDCNTLATPHFVQVSIDLTAAPIGYAGQFDRIALFNSAGGNPGAMYVDDISLLEPANDLVFRNGFEGDALPPAACPMAVQRDVSVNGMLSDTFSWCDAAGKPRSAALAHNDGQTGPGGTRGGELRQFTYSVGGATRTVNASSSSTAGWGYPVSHPGGDSQYCTGAKIDSLYNDPYDDNGLIGHFRGGSFTRVFEGRHHAIFRFTTSYPLYCSTTNTPPLGYIVPVTIEWTFASGRDNPLWSITWDLSGVPQDKLEYDSRAPYGELLFDGSATEAAHSAIAGVAWGDQYKFTSTQSPLTLNSTWDWTQANTVPYAKLWTSAIDATMGAVSTQPIAQFDMAGYFDVVKFWGHTSAQLAALGGNCNGVTAYLMPCTDFWPYQTVNYSFSGNNVATNNTRFAWGTEYGFLGLGAYHRHGSTWWGGPLSDTPASGWPRKSYSLYLVLGTHGGAPVDAQVGQVEVAQSLMLSASLGSVATQGLAGVNRADTITYSPPGYDPLRGALAFNAVNNALDANIALGAGTLSHPLVIVRGYDAAAYPATIKLNGTTLVADLDYFASVRAAPYHELWITLARDLAGSTNRLEIMP